MSDNPLLSAPREAYVPLYPRDVEKKIDEFDQQIEDAWREEAMNRRMSSPAEGESPADKLAAKRDAFVAKVRKTTPKAVLREIGQRQYQTMLDKHPPRKNNQGDENVGYNRDTFPPVLIRACLVEPVVTDEQFEEFVEQCPPGRWGDMIEKSLEVTLGEVELPKSSAVSALRELRGRVRKQRGVTR